MKFFPCALLVLLASSLSAAEPRSREKGLFDFRDGDRVVFLGSGFIERLQNTGYLETMLTAAMPGKNITFRNLGWSGDTVWGDARVVFGNRADGFERLLSDVSLCNPTVLLVCYGENEAFAGEAGLKEFRAGLNTLLDSLEATGARIVLLGPRQHHKMNSRLPDARKYNDDLRRYNDVTDQVAKEREHGFIDLYEAGPPFEEKGPVGHGAPSMTDSGYYLSDYGDEVISTRIAERLGARIPEFSITVDIAKQSVDALGCIYSDLTVSPESVRLVVQRRTIDVSWVRRWPPLESERVRSVLTVGGLAAGNYELSVDGENASGNVSGEDWGDPTFPAAFLPLPEERAQLLRQAINDKNTLFFHRYRPQNETYLFLFRKHEQGNNAVEIPQFDSLIAELEKKIAPLKKPVKQKYELVKIK